MSAALAYPIPDAELFAANDNHLNAAPHSGVSENACKHMRVYLPWALLAQGAPPPSNRWRATPRLHGMGQTLARIKNGVFTYLAPAGALSALNHSPRMIYSAIAEPSPKPDHLGSPQLGTGENGNVAFREAYTPYGEALLSPAANDNHSGFTGHIKDKSTGLNYMQARYYDPNIGRFLSIDPVTFTGSGYDPRYFNRYAYAGNDPINHLDPDGQAIGKAIKFVRNTIKHKGNPIKGAAETLSGIGDDLGTLTDGQLNLDDAAAVVSLITGFDKKDQKAIGGAAKKLNNRRGKDFTKAQKRDFKKNNADANGGNMTCEDCGRNDLQNIGNKKGQPTPPNQAQVHHDPAIKNGGGRDSDGKVLCPECHQQRHRDEK